ncbi:MAG: hypothetical protein ACRYG7_15375 [Janthinobacterium lividum]
MKSFLTLASAVLGALTLTSCFASQEPTCSYSSYAPIVRVVGPKVVGVNQAAVFVLGYVLGADCGTFSSITAVPNGNVQQIGVMGLYNGCACNQTTTVLQTSYQFQATTPGTYYLQFLATNNTFITDTVVVK